MCNKYQMQRGDANRNYRLGNKFLLDPILWMDFKITKTFHLKDTSLTWNFKEERVCFLWGHSAYSAVNTLHSSLSTSLLVFY